MEKQNKSVRALDSRASKRIFQPAVLIYVF
jgi:hypothetical protein